MSQKRQKADFLLFSLPPVTFSCFAYLLMEKVVNLQQRIKKYEKQIYHCDYAVGRDGGGDAADEARA